MKYIITIIAAVLSFSVMGQIAPYQIINDEDGQNRILMTNSDGEYVRVDLGDAISDSLEFDKLKIPVLTRLPYWQYVSPSTTNGIKCGVGINIHSYKDYRYVSYFLY